MVEIFYSCTLLANAAWFGSAFWYFGIKRVAASKLLVPRTARSSPIFASLQAALPFLGGMNAAFSVLATALLAINLFGSGDLFAAPGERIVLLGAFGLAHSTQFLVNVPIAQGGGRIGESYWDVLHGPMLFIFVVDAAMTLLNIACALVLTGT